MFQNKNPKKEKWFAYTVASCSAVVLYVALTNLTFFVDVFSNIISVISPIIYGVVIAYIMGPICDFIERTLYCRIKSRRMAKVASVATGVIMLLILFTILLVSLLPQLADSIVTFASNIGIYAEQLNEMVDETSKTTEVWGIDVSSVIDTGYLFVNDMISSIPQRLNGLLAVSYSFGVSVANIVLAFILAVYFLLDSENLLGGIQKACEALFSYKKYKTMSEFWSRCNKILIRYITFDLVDGAIVGILNFIFMIVLSMPYSVLISVIVGVTNLAPTFGPIAGGILGALILILVEPVDALVFIIFTLVLQTLDGYLIKPRLFGSSLGVPPVWILITIIVGGNVFGVVGILLAIPFAAIMTYVYRDILEKRIDMKRLERLAEESDQKEKQTTEENTIKA